VITIADQAELVSHVVEVSRQLCTSTTGSEALALQLRIDQLSKRYNNLAKEADAKIDVLSRAIPLSENLREGFLEIEDHLSGVEEDLENLDQVLLDEQFQLVHTIETDLEASRTQLDALQGFCIELQRLTSDKNANALQKETNNLLQRFNAVNEKVMVELSSQ